MCIRDRSYSYWHFTPEVTPLEDVFEAAAQLGLAGVEILHQQMASEENGYLQSLKRRAFQLGLDIYNFGIDQDFVWAEGEERQREIAPVSYTHLDVYKRQDVRRPGGLPAHGQQPDRG